jgi:hypothetical protein
MENRDRDKLSKNTGSTPSGDVNRNTSSNIGQQKSGSSAEFGQKTGRSENIGGSGDLGRSSGSSGLGSSSGRSGSSSDVDSGDMGDMGDRKRGDMGNRKPSGGGSGSSNESL